MDLNQYIATLEQAPQRSARLISGRMIRAQRELLRVAKSVVHVKSHNLQDHLIIEPPTVIDAGVSEFVVDAPGASYADTEADRGGEHDFPSRTIEAGADVIQSAADDVAEILAQTLVGQG